MNRSVHTTTHTPHGVVARPCPAAMNHGSFGMWRSAGSGSVVVSTTGTKRSARRSRRQPT
jgi:hypothetical protein